MTYRPAWTRRPQPRHPKVVEYLFGATIHWRRFDRKPVTVRVWDAETDEELPSTTVAPGDYWSYRTTVPSIYVDLGYSSTRLWFTEGIPIEGAS